MSDSKNPKYLLILRNKKFRGDIVYSPAVDAFTKRYIKVLKAESLDAALEESREVMLGKLETGGIFYRGGLPDAYTEAIVVAIEAHIPIRDWHQQRELEEAHAHDNKEREMYERLKKKYG